MKKLLAMLLAMLMVLTGTLALAEGDDILEAPEDQATFAGVTITSQFAVNADVLANALTAFGIEESYLDAANAVAAVLNGAGERVIIAADGLEYTFTLNEQNVLTVAAAMDESGLNVASDLFPSYVLNLSNESLAAILESLSGMLSGGDVDLTAALESFSAYGEEFINTCIGSVSFGDPQQGEFEAAGFTFNTMIPVNVDMQAIIDAAQTLTDKLANDEAVQAALQATGADIDFTTTDDEAVPTLTMEAYMNLDDEGNPASDTTVVTFTVTEPEGTEPATNGEVIVQGDVVTINLEFVTAGATLTFAYAPTATGGVTARLDADVQGIYVAIDTIAELQPEITLACDLYLLDSDNPLFSETSVITEGGELTAPVVADGKEVISIENLLAAAQGSEDETATEAIGNLMMDAMFNGIGTVLGNASQAMPDEIDNLMTLFQGEDDAEITE